MLARPKKRIRFRFVGLPLGLTFAMMLAGCGGSAPARSGTAPKAAPEAHAYAVTQAVPKATAAHKAKTLHKVSFVLSWLVSGEDAPFYLAQQEGLFKKQGLSVRIVPGKGSAVAVSQVANGDYTFGVAGAAVVMQYVSKGSPVKMVFDIARKSGNAVIYNASLPIRTPKDLEGHSIAFTPGGAAPTLLPAFLKLAHVNAAKVKLVSVRASQRDSLLLTHKVAAIDSTFTVEHGLLLSKGMRTKWFTYASAGLNLPYYGIVVKNSLLKTHPDIVRGFLRAIAQGMKDTQKNPMAAVKATAALSHAPDFKVAANLTVLKDNMTTWNTASSRGKPFGWMPPKDWTSAAKILERYMHLKPFDIQSAYTNAYVPQGAS